MDSSNDSYGLIRIKSIGLSKAGGRKACTLLQAAKHNLREAQEERGGRAHIDPDRKHLNVVIAGPPTAAGVVAFAHEKMHQAGVEIRKLRCDHVQAIELMFSLHTHSGLDEVAYFQACQDWTAKWFGPSNMLSAVIHRDEPAPHCHVLVLPLVDGKMIAKRLKSRQALASLRAAFYADIASVFGLSWGNKRLTAAQRRITTDAVLTHLDISRDPCTRSPVWQVVRDSIESDPRPYAGALGLSLDLPAPTPKKLPTSTQIFTSTGKGAKYEKTGPPQRL